MSAAEPKPPVPQAPNDLGAQFTQLSEDLKAGRLTVEQADAMIEAARGHLDATIKAMKNSVGRLLADKLHSG